MHGDSLLMLTTKVVSNKKPPLLSDSESGGSTSHLDEFHAAVACANLVGYILKIQKRKNSIDHILKGVKQLVDVGIPLGEKTEKGL